MKKKTVQAIKMHNIYVCTYKYQDFVQSQENFGGVARLWDHDIKKLSFGVLASQSVSQRQSSFLEMLLHLSIAPKQKKKMQLQ